PAGSGVRATRTRPATGRGRVPPMGAAGIARPRGGDESNARPERAAHSTSASGGTRPRTQRRRGGVQSASGRSTPPGAFHGEGSASGAAKARYQAHHPATVVADLGRGRRRRARAGGGRRLRGGALARGGTGGPAQGAGSNGP